MAHIGKQWPLHWRRDMSLGQVNHQQGWCMYAARNFQGFQIPGVTGLGFFDYYELSAQDWDGLSFEFSSKPVNKYGRIWEIHHTLTIVDDCTRLAARMRIQNNVDGEVMDGVDTRTFGNLTGRWFGVYDIDDCLQPTKFRPFQSQMADVAYVPSWAEWHAQFPGMDPWKPPQP